MSLLASIFLGIYLLGYLLSAREIAWQEFDKSSQTCASNPYPEDLLLSLTLGIVIAFFWPLILTKDLCRNAFYELNHKQHFGTNDFAYYLLAPRQRRLEYKLEKLQLEQEDDLQQKLSLQKRISELEAELSIR